MRAAAARAAEYLGALLPDKPFYEVRRVQFERALAERIDARLTEFGECWLTVRGEPDELISSALREAGIPLGRDPIAARPVLPRVHLRVRPDRLMPLVNGVWQRIIKVSDADAVLTEANR